jgi:hypothetical protein
VAEFADASIVCPRNPGSNLDTDIIFFVLFATEWNSNI